MTSLGDALEELLTNPSAVAQLNEELVGSDRVVHSSSARQVRYLILLCAKTEIEQLKLTPRYIDISDDGSRLEFYTSSQIEQVSRVFLLKFARDLETCWRIYKSLEGEVSDGKYYPGLVRTKTVLDNDKIRKENTLFAITPEGKAFVKKMIDNWRYLGNKSRRWLEIATLTASTLHVGRERSKHEILIPRKREETYESSKVRLMRQISALNTTEAEVPIAWMAFLEYLGWLEEKWTRCGKMAMKYVRVMAENAVEQHWGGLISLEEKGLREYWARAEVMKNNLQQMMLPVQMTIVDPDSGPIPEDDTGRMEAILSKNTEQMKSRRDEVLQLTAGMHLYEQQLLMLWGAALYYASLKGWSYDAAPSMAPILAKASNGAIWIISVRFTDAVLHRDVAYPISDHVKDLLFSQPALFQTPIMWKDANALVLFSEEAARVDGITGIEVQGPTGDRIPIYP